MRGYYHYFLQPQLKAPFSPTKSSIKPDPAYDWFYGSKRNQFWAIIEQVYGTSLPDKTSKMNLCTKLDMGVADIIYQCERAKNNSLDNNLINIVYNPELGEIICRNKIQTIFFSSRFVENQFRKNFKNILAQYPHILLFTLPSPSPRYALMTKEAKVRRYKELLPIIPDKLIV